MFSTPLTCCSIGAATVSATTWALAPGYWQVTLTVGGAIGGYIAIGSDQSEIAAGERDRDRQDRGEDRSVDEEARKHGRGSRSGGSGRRDRFGQRRELGSLPCVRAVGGRGSGRTGRPVRPSSERPPACGGTRRRPLAMGRFDGRLGGVGLVDGIRPWARRGAVLGVLASAVRLSPACADRSWPGGLALRVRAAGFLASALPAVAESGIFSALTSISRCGAAASRSTTTRVARLDPLLDLAVSVAQHARASPTSRTMATYMGSSLSF